MIPEPEIEALKSQVDFLYLLKTYGFKPIKKGKDFFINCPFHKDDKPSLSIDPAKNLYHCFGCGAKGNAIQFVQNHEGLSFGEAVAKVKKEVNVSNILKDPSKESLRDNPKENLPTFKRDLLLKQVFESMQKSFKKSSVAKEYLQKTRGIKYLEQIEVGFCPKDFGKRLSAKTRDDLKTLGLLNLKGQAFFSDCVVFALKDNKGQIQSLYGRSCFSSSGGHYYLPGKREGLFFSRSKESAKDADSLILVESVIDALTLIDNGFLNVLSLYGVNGFSDLHKEFIAQGAFKEIYLLLDGDRAGREASHRLASCLNEINKNLNIHPLSLPEGEDPNSYIKTKEGVNWLESNLNLKTCNPCGSSLSACALISEEEGYRLIGDEVIYSLQGLQLHGFDKLRLTLRVHLKEREDLFYIDTLDLYSSRQRSRFCEEAALELGIKEESLELKGLIPLLERERLKKKSSGPLKRELSVKEKQEALKALKDKGLIRNLLRDFEVCGMVGEEKAKLLGYLGTISRFLDKPLGVLIISRSGAGKTTLQEAFCNFVPEEDLNKYSRISEKVLFYKGEEGLKHKVLAIEEEEGMNEATYSIRTLQSSQMLSSITTRNDPKSGVMSAEEYTVKGPVFIVISTTNPEALDYETRNRFIILTIDESKSQTKKILDSLKTSYTLEGLKKDTQKEEVFKRCRNMQRLLRPLKVVNPFASTLDYPSNRLQMRREFKKYMTLINAIALLHQYQREIKEEEGVSYIEVEPSDIALANELVLEFFPNSSDDMAPHTRNFSQELMALIESKGGDVKFTRKEVRDFSGWSDWSIRKALEQLEQLEYIRRASGKNGSVITYEMLVDPRTDKRQELLLSEVSQLERGLKAVHREQSSLQSV